MRSGLGECIVFIAAVALLVFPRCISAQQSNSTTASGSGSTRMIICESTDSACAQSNAQYGFVWSFDGATGTIASPASDSGTELTIESMDQDRIVIHRIDRAGATAGRSGTYVGSVHGSRIAGTVQWLWEGHSGYPASTTWSAIIQDQLAPAAAGTTPSETGLPARLLECENNGPCNAAWTIDDSTGKATWFLQKPVRAELTVIRSAPDDILIRRTDLTDGNSAVYSGRLNGGSYSGAVVWSSPGHPGTSSGHWSASVPQTSCEGSSGLSSEDALSIGQPR